MASEHNRIAYALSIALLVLLAAEPASAGFGVSGAILRAEVLPGESISHAMTVRIAENETPLDFVAEVAGFGQTLSGGYLLLGPETDTSPYSARDFLRVSRESFSIEPGSSVELLLEGEIPPDVGAGGRYVLVEIRSLPAGDGPAGVAFAIDVPVFLTINGTELVKTGEITELKVGKTDEEVDGETENSYSSGKILVASLIFKNSGNHHYRALAEAVLKDRDGNVLASGETPLDEASIIPTASRLFEIPLHATTEPTAGTHRLEAKVLSEDGSTLAVEEIVLFREKP